MADKRDKPSGMSDEGTWDSANRIWLAGLAAFARAQEEGNRLFDTLVNEGETLQKRSREHLDDSMGNLLGRASHTWDQLGQVFEDQVSHALGRLGVPSQQDIQDLSERIEALKRKLEELQK